ncbi:MAG: DegT/DnrJ/EryC1/StrS family aminotransferase [Spirochaetaceae bacterium]|jgi:dTDP-4-amino-4,6-dideoxygalactose transaminase|nr:DegT/DnrJ/EryC1/StrS family aminotransferase [Spirochaetaceae bacterium]
MKIEVWSPTIRRKEMDAVLTAMVADRVGPGEGSRLLLQIAKEHLEFDYALALRSPAIALFFALRALALADGDRVAVSALSPRYYSQVIADLRLRAVYCDVDKGTAVMGAETVSAAMAAENCRCAVVHHTLGYTPGTAAIAALGIPVIEDISQGYGSSVDGKRTGSCGLFTILGLEEEDMLTAGGGALLYAANRRDAAVLRSLSPLAEYSLPDMNAAMAAVQFREAGRNLEKRREIAKVYTQAALRTRHRQFALTENTEYNHYAFPLILETGMKDVTAYAKKKEIAVESAFVNAQIASLEGAGEKWSEAWSLSLRTALFPLYPRLSSAETEKVARLIMTLP